MVAIEASSNFDDPIFESKLKALSQTDENLKIRNAAIKILEKNYAMIGGTYDADKDAFIAVKPSFASWQLNEETCIWEAPVPMPDDHETNPVRWDEENQEWVDFTPLGDEPDLGEKP